MSLNIKFTSAISKFLLQHNPNELASHHLLVVSPQTRNDCLTQHNLPALYAQCSAEVEDCLIQLSERAQ